jgi:hypothetical protein
MVYEGLVQYNPGPMALESEKYRALDMGVVVRIRGICGYGVQLVHVEFCGLLRLVLVP